MNTTTGNEFLEALAESLIKDFDYVKMNVLKDAGLNALELKGDHTIFGEHLIMWNLDEDDFLQYIIATPNHLNTPEKHQLREETKFLLNSLISSLADKITIKID